MKESDKKILLVIAAIAILALTYMYVFSPTKEKVDALSTEVAQLQTKYNDLKAKEADRDRLEKETKEFREEFNQELVKYPADLNQESTVMFLKGVEEQMLFLNRSISLGRPTAFYILGQGQVGGDSAVLDGSEDTSNQYICTRAEFPISYEGTYEGVKQYLAYIASYRYRSNIQNININFDSITGICTGSVTYAAYAVSGPDRNPDTVQTGEPIGVQNIFLGGDGVSVQATPDKYDATQGAEIATTHNLVMLLNSAANDTTSGLIIASNESDESTFVTSTANSVEHVNITVYSQDGKNFVSYSMGGNKYETEILTEDVTIYVKSSNRVDANDTNGVDVQLSNTTNLSVFFKVVGDDAVTPRFVLGSKSGTVKVY